MVFHTCVILFNVFGWILKPLRKYNLALLLLTAASWFILGIWYGWGYCICTDWHWDVLKKLGRQHLPNSYVKFLIDRVFNTNINADLVNYATIVIFFAALTVSIILNIRDYRRRR